MQVTPHLSTNSYGCERTHPRYSVLLSLPHLNQKNQAVPYSVWSNLPLPTGKNIFCNLSGQKELQGHRICQCCLLCLEPHASETELCIDTTFIRCISASWSWDLLRTVGGVVWISVVPSVKGEEELALFSTSVAFVADCWNTLGDKSTEGVTVVVAVTNCGGATWKRTEN